MVFLEYNGADISSIKMLDLNTTLADYFSTMTAVFNCVF